MKKLSENHPNLNISKLSKKAQEKEDEIGKNMQKANQYWNDCKIQCIWILQSFQY